MLMQNMPFTVVLLACALLDHVQLERPAGTAWDTKLQEASMHRITEATVHHVIAASTATRGLAPVGTMTCISELLNYAIVSCIEGWPCGGGQKAGDISGSYMIQDPGGNIWKQLSTKKPRFGTTHYEDWALPNTTGHYFTIERDFENIPDTEVDTGARTVAFAGSAAKRCVAANTGARTVAFSGSAAKRWVAVKRWVGARESQWIYIKYETSKSVAPTKDPRASIDHAARAIPHYFSRISGRKSQSKSEPLLLKLDTAHKNMILKAASASEGPLPAWVSFFSQLAVGQAVLLKDLVSRPDLTGKSGVVKSFDPSTLRYTVMVDVTGESVIVLLENFWRCGQLGKIM